MWKKTWMGTLLAAAALSGCMSAPGVSEDPCGEDSATPGDVDCSPDSAGDKSDAWNWTNDPARFARNLNYRLSELPLEGVAERIAWSSTYWPYTEDSTNVRWQGAGQWSAVEKYDAAFNRWTPAATFGALRPMTACGGTFDRDYYAQLGPAARWQSENKGNFAMRNGMDDDRDMKVDECETDSDGLEGWFGLCHAWVPASIIEPEPMHAVTFNGQRFETADIQALLISAYDRTDAVMLGGRCNAKTIERDERGRPRDASCSDTNAGAFHVVMANFLGLRHQAIAEDRTANYEVWNQPVVGFHVSRQDEISASDANGRLGAMGDTYAFNPKAKKLFYVEATTDYITETYPSTEPTTPNIGRYTRHDSYQYILELDEQGKVIGGEWVGESREHHPDFLWLPIRALGGNPSIELAQVHTLLELSRRDDTGGGTTTGTTFEANTAVDIPDNATTGATSSLTVDRDVSITGGVSVSVEIEHTYVGDLVVELVHGGRTVSLQRNQGGGADNLIKTFTIADFNGQSARGEWQLKVTDTASVDTGRIRKWSLTVQGGTEMPPPPPSTTGITVRNETATAIPDNNRTGVTSTVSVTGVASITNLRVAVDIEHPYIGDLVVELRNGTRTVTLHNRAGGSADNLIKTFDPTEFNGQAGDGTWTLFVKDTAAGDVGRLRSWSLTFNR